MVGAEGLAQQVVAVGGVALTPQIPALTRDNLREYTVTDEEAQGLAVKCIR